jgi:hypothetical protein
VLSVPVPEVSTAALLVEVAVSGAAAVVTAVVSRLAGRSAAEEQAASTTLVTPISGANPVIPVNTLMCLSLPCGIMRRCDSFDRMVHLYSWNLL